LATTGIACIIAAITAAGVTSAGLTIPVVPTLERQLLLAAFGVILLALAWSMEARSKVEAPPLPRPPDGFLIVGGALAGLGEVFLFMLVFVVVKGVFIGFEGGPARMLQRLQEEPTTAVALLVGAAIGAVVGWSIAHGAGRSGWPIAVAGCAIGVAVAWLFPPDVAPGRWPGMVMCGGLGLALGLVAAWRVWRLGW
jgi:hypothetical protein